MHNAMRRVKAILKADLSQIYIPAFCFPNCQTLIKKELNPSKMKTKVGSSSDGRHFSIRIPSHPKAAAAAAGSTADDGDWNGMEWNEAENEQTQGRKLSRKKSFGSKKGGGDLFQCKNVWVVHPAYLRDLSLEHSGMRGGF